MVDARARAEYEQNLVNLIKDVRAELQSPQLPVVVGELGNLSASAGAAILEIRAAQQKATQHPDLELVRFVSTNQFARPAQQSPNVGHGHHWFGNAESYFLVGESLGKAMIELTEL